MVHHEKAVAFGHVVIDDVQLADGTRRPPTLGGAGAYAALGQAMVVPEVLLVSGVGEDLPIGIRAELIAAGIDDRGLVALDPRTPRTEIEYFADGERREVPAFGLEHFEALDPSPEMIPSDVRPAAVYVFGAIEPSLFASIRESRAETGAPVLWEVHAEICDPVHLGAVTRQTAGVDVLSLNRAEACALLGADDLHTALPRLADLAPIVLLRLGDEGAAVLEDGRILRARPPVGAVVDPTGAGNACSGAFIAALAAGGRDAEGALRAAMAASALTIRQLGPPRVDSELRADHSLLSSLLDVTTTPLKNGNLL